MRVIILILFLVFTISLMIHLYKLLKHKTKMILCLPLLIIIYVYLFFTIDGSVRLCLLLYGYPNEACTAKIRINKNMSTRNTKYILTSKRIEKYPSYFKCKKYGPFKITTYYGF